MSSKFSLFARGGGNAGRGGGGVHLWGPASGSPRMPHAARTSTHRIATTGRGTALLQGSLLLLHTHSRYAPPFPSCRLPSVSAEATCKTFILSMRKPSTPCGLTPVAVKHNHWTKAAANLLCSSSQQSQCISRIWPTHTTKPMTVNG